MKQKLPLRIISLVVCCLVLTLMGTAAVARDLNENEKKLIESIRSNATKIKSASMKIRVESGAGDIDETFRKILGQTKGNYVEKGSEEIQIRFSGGCFWRTSHTSNRMHGETTTSTLDQQDAWDGETYYTYRPDAKYGILDKSYASYGSQWTDNFPFAICSLRMGEPLDTYLETAFSGVNDTEVGIGVLDINAKYEKRKAWMVTIKHQDGTELEVYYFDPTNNLRLMLKSEGDSTWNISYKNEGEYQIPYLLQMKAYNTNGNVRGYSTTTIEELTRINQPFEKKEFQIQYPADAKVVDVKNKNNK